MQLLNLRSCPAENRFADLKAAPELVFRVRGQLRVLEFKLHSLKLLLRVRFNEGVDLLQVVLRDEQLLLELLQRLRQRQLHCVPVALEWANHACLQARNQPLAQPLQLVQVQNRALLVHIEIALRAEIGAVRLAEALRPLAIALGAKMQLLRVLRLLEARDLAVPVCLKGALEAEHQLVLDAPADRILLEAHLANIRVFHFANGAQN